LRLREKHSWSASALNWPLIIDFQYLPIILTGTKAYHIDRHYGKAESINSHPVSATAGRAAKADTPLGYGFGQGSMEHEEL
jgi:hypothetical protein